MAHALKALDVCDVPDYRGLKWIGATLPSATRTWPSLERRFRVIPSHDFDREIRHHEVAAYAGRKPWVWPSHVIYFFCDVHADADAFFSSLVASGGVAKTGPTDDALRLTKEGRKATFVIGGDCLDKGPSNLRLLRALKRLIDLGADVRILAGNHDLRALLGLHYAGHVGDPRLGHLFVRMGKKAVPLFREVWDEYLSDKRRSRLWSEPRVRRHLMPDRTWYDEFPSAVQGAVPEARIAKEVARIEEKVGQFERECAALGMSLGMVHAALEKCRELFLDPSGEFAWFYRRMSLAYRAGSFLYIHAGVDDTMANALRVGGVEAANAWFHRLMEQDLFALYHGPVGNAFRTKYRDIDWPLTDEGVSDMHRAGLYAVVHGHRNLLEGQRIVLRRGLLQFECDCSVDAGTRSREGLPGTGAAVTVFQPGGRVCGISTDDPYVKVFDPATYCPLTTIV